MQKSFSFLLAILFLLFVVAAVGYNLDVADQVYSSASATISYNGPVNNLTDWFEQLLPVDEVTLLDSGNISTARITVVNILFVLVYSVFIAGLVRFGKTQTWINDDQEEHFIDSVYFYGFVLTLAALIIAISPIGSGVNPGEETKSLARIVGSNAVALSSTLAGLVLRTFYNLVFYSSDRENDPVDVYEAAVERLAAINSNAALSMERTATAMGEAAQKLTRDLNASSNQISKVVTDLEKDLRTSAKMFVGATKGINDELALLRERLAGLQFDEDLFAKYIAQATEKVLQETEGSLQEFAKTVSSETSVFKDAVETMQEASASGARNISESLSKTAKAFADIDPQASTDDALTRATQPLHTTSLDAAQSFEAAINQLNSALIRVAGAQQSTLETQRASLDALRLGFERAMAELRDNVDKGTIEKVIAEQSRIAFDPLKDAMTQASTALDASYGSIREAMERAATAQVNLAAKTEPSVEKAEEALARLEELKNGLDRIREDINNSYLNPHWLEQTSQRFETLSGSLDTLNSNMARESRVRRPFFQKMQFWKSANPQTNDEKKNKSGSWNPFRRG